MEGMKRGVQRKGKALSCGAPSKQSQDSISPHPSGTIPLDIGLVHAPVTFTQSHFPLPLS